MSLVNKGLPHLEFKKKKNIKIVPVVSEISPDKHRDTRYILVDYVGSFSLNLYYSNLIFTTNIVRDR